MSNEAARPLLIIDSMSSEVTMEQTVHNFLNIKDLNNTWVIVKRHNGNVFFKRRGYITCLKNCPDSECLYYDQFEALKQVELLNSRRKKCKYSIENASKYFVNSYNADTWNRVHIYNNPIPIKDAQKSPHKVNSFDNARKRIQDVINENAKRAKKDLDILTSSMQTKLKELETRLINEIQEANITLNRNNEIVNNFEKFDFNQIDQFETQGDKIFKVLFQKSERKSDVPF